MSLHEMKWSFDLIYMWYKGIEDKLSETLMYMYACDALKWSLQSPEKMDSFLTLIILMPDFIRQTGNT